MNIPNRNAMSYSNRKGLVSSIISSFSFISTSVFTYISDSIVNPDKKKIEEGQEFFPMEIAERVHIYYEMVLVCILAANILSILTLCKYTPPKPKTISDNEYGKVNELEKQENKNVLTIPQMPPANNKLTVPPLSLTLSFSVIPDTSFYDKTKNYKRNLKNILGTCRVWRISLIRVLTTYSIIMSTNTFKTLGTKKGISTAELTFTMSTTYIAIIALGFLIGWLADSISLRVLFAFINIFSALSCYFMPYSLNNKIYLVFKLLGACNIVFKFSTRVIMLVHLYKVYTQEYFMESMTTTNVTSIIIEFAGSLFPFLVDKYLGADYYVLPFWVGLGCNVLGFLVCLFEGENQFDLKKLKKFRQKVRREIEEIPNKEELVINEVNTNDL